MEKLKEEYVAELRSLMVTWETYQASKWAADAEFVAVGQRIRKLCDFLDGMQQVTPKTHLY